MRRLVAVALVGAVALSATAQVRQSWVTLYDGIGSRDDHAMWVAADGIGGAWVTGATSPGYGYGSDATTLRLTSSGAIDWLARFGALNAVESGRRIALTSEGFPVVLVGVNRSIGTLMYGSPGTEPLWSALYSSGLGVSAMSMALDSAGDVFVAGSAFSSTAYDDYVVIKYSGQTGQQLWAARYGGTGDDDLMSIAVDKNGDVIATGRSIGDIATVKFDGRTGTQLWLNRYNGPGDREDEGRHIALDDAGSAFVCGHVDRAGAGRGGNDMVALKIDGQTGLLIWTALFDGLGSNHDSAIWVAVGPDGNPIIAGSTSPANLLSDFTVIKYDGSTGDLLWQSSYNGPADDNDEPSMLAVDAEGAAYVIGFSVGLGSVRDFATLKLDGETGARLWAKRFNGPYNYTDVPRALSLDEMGNVFVTGSSYVGTRLFDYAVIKYSQHRTGDADGDGCVSDSDLATVLESYGQIGLDLQADLNGDEIVDDVDLAIVLSRFGSGCR